MKELKELLQKVEAVRVRLAQYFCEDAAKYKLEDCFKILNELCKKIVETKKVSFNVNE